MSRRWYLPLIGALAAFAAYASYAYGHGQLRWIAAGGSYFVAGLYAWYRRPGSRTGPLLVLTGLGIWSSLAEATRVPLLWSAGSALEGLWFPPLVYLMLSFPRGRLSSAFARYLVVAAVTLVAVGGIFGSLFYDPRDFGCTDCQPGLNVILVHASAEYVRYWGSLVLLAILVAELAVFLFLWGRSSTARVRRTLVLGAVVATTLLLTCLLLAREDTLHYLRLVSPLLVLPSLVVGLVVTRWFRATPPARRVLGPMVLPATAFLLAVAGQQLIGVVLDVWTVFKPQPWLFTFLTNTAVVGAVSLPVSFLLGLARARQRHTVVSDLVLDLGDLPPAKDLERTLSRALRDPSLQVGRWDPGSLSYVTASGDELALPGEGTTRTATLLERDGTPLAAIVHDEALLDSDGLLSSVAAATRLVVENQGLQAEVQAQLEDVRASRARIVAAADAERRRLERDLHDGAQQRIVSVCLDLKLAASKLASDAEPHVRRTLEDAAAGLQEALAELRELARGIHPALLTEEGLGPALQSLSERARVPSRVIYEVPGRLRPTVEATAYFVASEALTNVAKHARASTATIAVRHVDGRLVLEVEDDGVGGADLSRGSGLRGLADRLGAVDGELHILSADGSGTRLRAEIPCA